MTIHWSREAARAASFLIAAVDEAGVIGSAGALPWRHRADLRHFRDATRRCALVVGRTTFDGLPAGVTGRPFVVVTSRPVDADVASIRDVADAEDATASLGADAMAFAGGARVYAAALALPWMRRALITRIAGRHDGDAFLPELGPEWRVVDRRRLASEPGEPDAVVETMVR